MKGYSYKDMQAARPARGGWRRLKADGEQVRCAFIVDQKDDDWGAVFYAQHPWNGKTYPICKREPGDPIEKCPLCVKSGGTDQSWRMRITIYNLETKERERLDGFPAVWFEDLRETLEMSDPLTTAWIIKRKGQKSNTRRLIKPAGALTQDEQAAVLNMDPFPKAELLFGLDRGEAQSDDSTPDHSEDGDPGPEDEVPF